MPPVVVSSEPFDRLMRSLELRVVEVQLAQAVSLVDTGQLHVPATVLDVVHLARIHHGELLGHFARVPAEVLANRRALGPDLTHRFDISQ